MYRANKETETTKSRIISGDFAKVVKGITKGNSRKSLAKTLFSSNLQPQLHACFIKKIKQELSDLLSTKTVSILRQVNYENLANFRIDNLNLQIQLKSPTFYHVVSEMVKDSQVGISVASLFVTSETSTCLCCTTLFLRY